MQLQKHLFSLSDEVTYLNGAYMSPQLKSITEVGLNCVAKKEEPYRISPDDFFKDREMLKKRFAKLIGAADYRNTAIIPSVSYGIANAAHNVSVNMGDEILIIDEQFPSNYYIWKRIADEKGAIIKIVKPSIDFNNRGQIWNENILKAITEKTAVIAMAHIHWADGTLFDLKAIREKSLKHNAKLIIDGTQSIGAYPFSIKDIPVDALVCGGYKWLLGPYSIGMAYYNDSFNDGRPIEENWMNRLHSEDFSGLTEYENNYQEKAARYSVGESSNFILTPMLKKAIEQLIDWQPQNIQEYCKNISTNAIEILKNSGFLVEDQKFRASHLFGIYLTEKHNLNNIKTKLQARNILVSYRGKAIRVSCNVYNNSEDFEKLLEAILD